MILPLIVLAGTFPDLWMALESDRVRLGGEAIMPVHDWTRVEAGIFHDFHVAWIPEIRKVLNGGLLPEGYYALAEQHTGPSIAEILTLHASPTPPELPPWPLPPATGGTAVA